MKRRNLLFPLLITAMGWGSCAKNDPGNVGNGSLVVRLDVDPTVRVVTASATKSADAATFTLEILQNETVIKKLSPIGRRSGAYRIAFGSLYGADLFAVFYCAGFRYARLRRIGGGVDRR